MGLGPLDGTLDVISVHVGSFEHTIGVAEISPYVCFRAVCTYKGRWGVGGGVSDGRHTCSPTYLGFLDSPSDELSADVGIFQHTVWVMEMPP